jgi:hypothetical protein
LKLYCTVYAVYIHIYSRQQKAKLRQDSPYFERIVLLNVMPIMKSVTDYTLFGTNILVCVPKDKVTLWHFVNSLTFPLRESYASWTIGFSHFPLCLG